MGSFAENTSEPGAAAPTVLPPRRPFRLDRRWLVLVPALLVLLIYLPALNYQLVWDDNLFLRDSPVYRDADLWPTAVFRWPFVLSSNYYRPLALLTFVSELALGGLNPTLFHLTNLLLHTINTALVTLLAMRLLGQRSAKLQPGPPNLQPLTLLPLGLGLLYGLHPALLEGVVFVSSRFDLLMTTFLLLALLADVSVRGRWARPVMVGLAFLLATLCKEMAVAFALALPFWHLAMVEEPVDPSEDRRNRWRANLVVYAAVLLAGVVYLLLRWGVLGHLLQSSSEMIAAGSPLQHLLLVGKSLASYVVLIVWPFTSLTPIHYSELPVAGNALDWLSLVLVGLLVAGLVWLLRRAPRPGWLMLAGVLALLPVANILPLELSGGAFVAERYLLFPMALLVLGFGLFLRPLLVPAKEVPGRRISWQQVRPALAVGLPLLWLVAGLVTVQLTLPMWRDNPTLWNWAASRAPKSSLPPTNLALEYVGLGRYDLALQLAQKAIDLDSNNADAWDNAGLALFFQQKYPEAQKAFESAVSLQPNNPLYWNNLAGALRDQGDLVNAEKVLVDQVLKLDANLPIAHLNLGIVYLRAARPDLAAQHLQIAIHLLPAEDSASAQDLLKQTQQPDIWMSMGDLMLQNSQLNLAAMAYDRAAALGAPLADAAYGLTSALIGLEDWQNASQVLDQVLQTVTEDARLYYNAGIVAREQGDIEQARQYFSQAVELKPDWDLPQQALQALPGQ